MGSRKYDIGVIGSGIIGLATAMRLSQEHPRSKVVVVEKESRIAQHQTGHNSGVIHAGIYYAPGSQKANFCSTGGAMLRRFCDRHEVPYEMCGKLIVAVDETEVSMLEELYRRGSANGAEGLEIVGQERLREIEPHAAGVQAIWSPNTGIVNYDDVSSAFCDEMREKGGELIPNAEVTGIARRNGTLNLETAAGDVEVGAVINCAGLHADSVAMMMGQDVGVRIIPFRGEYLSLKPEKAHLVNGLIYPVPDPRLPFLGVHFTKRISGSVEAGPNAVLALKREGYSKTSFDLGDTMDALKFPGFWRMSRKYWKVGINEQYRSVIRSAFVRSLQTLVPELQDHDLHMPGAGVRAQAVDTAGNLVQDFSIAQTENAIHVVNAPSPGATSSLAISRYIVDLAKRSFDLN
ncbi:MAG: L-2-hydroxyglutarate oxidase [SAR202 cluster bacterium]|nr:L-2-hydroxyglutarate oxidase [SAR202 cluster bacterium]MQG56622.1 L-2-hydroxyglutarate oxidase [SAR202 cluster bacterium]MQG70373.1 L-2-hydroxyglutarate oxidase [SAR202 cluster bacterium]HAL49089.1 L-2-hydroxyglutarate oxidase [Dehalococcoidia bacterium]